MPNRRAADNDDLYHKPVAGEWVQLSLPPNTNFDSCCGCGLVHRFDLKLAPITVGKHKGELTIWRRMFIDERATNQIRKQRAESKELRAFDGYYIAIFDGPARARAKEGSLPQWPLTQVGVSR